MTAPSDGGKRRRRRHLTPQEKYQVWQEVVAGQGTRREIADRWGIDRSTVVHIVKLAKQGALERLATSKPGRPGKSAAGGRPGRDRAAQGHGDRTGRGAAPVPGKRSLGLIAGPVPTRVDAGIKAGLLALVDHAVAHGWSTRRACEVLEVGPVRLTRWGDRRDAGRSLADAPSGPAEALHGLLDWERAAILELFDTWGEATGRTASWPTAARGCRRSGCPNPASYGSCRPST